MKKVIMAIVFAFLVAFTGCTRSTITSEKSANAQTDEQNTEETAEETTYSDEDYSFYELEYDHQSMVEFYRFEVSRRLRRGGNFFTEDEQSWLQANDYIITNEEDGVVYQYNSFYKKGQYYIHPIVVYYKLENQLLYVEDDGDLVVDYEIVGNANLTLGERESLGNVEVIGKTEMSTIIYIQDKGIEKYSLGKKTAQIPVKGVYCGKSFWCGYIFHDNADVYAVNWNIDQDTYEKKAIAHNVKFVILADYKLGSDPWSQPLFLMEDGTVKAYLDWNNKEIPDSPDNLVDPFYEGGYKVTW